MKSSEALKLTDKIVAVVNRHSLVACNWDTDAKTEFKAEVLDVISEFTAEKHTYKTPSSFDLSDADKLFDLKHGTSCGMK